jgi:hypothetical protein
VFRYHVLHRIEGLLHFNVTPLSTLTTAGPESLSRLNERMVGWKNERFGSASFVEDLEEFNDRTAPAAAAEPLCFGRLFGFWTYARVHRARPLDDEAPPTVSGTVTITRRAVLTRASSTGSMPALAKTAGYPSSFASSALDAHKAPLTPPLRGASV